MKKMNIEQIQDLLGDALQSDLENGVAWLNEQASAEFHKNYPALSEAISDIFAIDEDEEE